jgi:hypothetical protein
VVLIDVEIADGFDLHVERAMPREKLEHVIEKANARADLIPALAFEADCEGD